MEKTAGQAAYEAYLASCGGVSIRGEPLPSWHGQSELVKSHWERAAEAARAWTPGPAETD